MRFSDARLAVDARSARRKSLRMNETSRALCAQFVIDGQWDDVARLLGHIDEEIREAAAAVCAGFASQRATDLTPVLAALAARLSDEDEIAKEAAYALVFHHLSRLEIAAVEALLGNERTLVQQASAFAVGNAVEAGKDAAPLEPALTRLLTSSDEGVAYCATRALLLLNAAREDGSAIRALLSNPQSASAARAVLAGAVCSAAAQNDAAGIRLWLEAGAPADSESSDGETALVLAAKAGALDAVRALLDGGAAIDRQDGAKRTALMHAAYQGRADVVGLLLERSADMNVKSAADFTALDYALKGNEAEIAALLDGKGAKIGDIDSVTSFAFAEGNVAICRIVLAHGPDLDKLDGNGLTPLMYSAMKGNEELVKMLLEKGAKPAVKSADGRTAAAFAKSSGH